MLSLQSQNCDQVQNPFFKLSWAHARMAQDGKYPCPTAFAPDKTTAINSHFTQQNSSHGPVINMHNSKSQIQNTMFC